MKKKLLFELNKINDDINGYGKLTKWNQNNSKGIKKKNSDQIKVGTQMKLAISNVCGQKDVPNKEERKKVTQKERKKKTNDKKKTEDTLVTLLLTMLR